MRAWYFEKCIDCPAFVHSPFTTDQTAKPEAYGYCKNVSGSIDHINYDGSTYNIPEFCPLEKIE